MRSVCRAALLGLLAAVCTPVSRAPAQRAQRFSLNWVRDAGATECIASHRLAALIERMLGPVFAVPADAELAIEGRVFRAERWRARIAVSDRAGTLLGTRELESGAESCRALDAQIVLVVAMAIDPEVADVGLPPELLAELDYHGDSAEELLSELRATKREAPPPPPPSNPSASAAAESASARQPRLRAAPAPEHTAPGLHDFRVALLADFALGLGIQPTLGSAAGLGASLQPLPSWTLALSLQWWFDKEAPIEVATDTGVAVGFQLAQATPVVCLSLLRATALRWSGCVGGSVSVRWTDATDLLRPRSDARVDFGPSLATELWLGPFGPLAPRIGAALHAPLNRARYRYRDGVSGSDRTLFEPAMAQAWAYLGAALLF